MQKKCEYQNETKPQENVSKTSKRDHILASTKVFKERPSYLTKLFNDFESLQFLYHIFIVCLLLMLLNSICHDYAVEGRIKFGLRTFKYAFGRIHYTLALLFCEHLVLFGLFYGAKLWNFVWLKLYDNAHLRFLWSFQCLTCYITVQIFMVYLITKANSIFQLPFISAFVLFLETTRLLMKIHAFVRPYCGNILSLDSKIAHKSKLNFPKFTSFLYFLFAPTLIYRNSYPRVKVLRWQFALARLFEVIAIAFLISFIYEQHISVHFGDFGLEPISTAALIVKLYSMLLPNSLIILCIFYVILHAVQNLFAELLRFGDRLFYTDWWNAPSYDVYFRRWNMLVQEWLYEFIYKDFYNHIIKRSKLCATLAVFLISAAVHEYILSFTMGFFFPVMFVFFIVLGIPFIYVSKNFSPAVGNIFLWLTLLLGNSLMISLYTMECMARLNLINEYNSWKDYVIPVTFKHLAKGF